MYKCSISEFPFLTHTRVHFISLSTFFFVSHLENYFGIPIAWEGNFRAVHKKDTRSTFIEIYMRICQRLGYRSSHIGREKLVKYSPSLLASLSLCLLFFFLFYSTLCCLKNKSVDSLCEAIWTILAFFLRVFLSKNMKEIWFTSKMNFKIK